MTETDERYLHALQALANARTEAEDEVRRADTRDAERLRAAKEDAETLERTRNTLLERLHDLQDQAARAVPERSGRRAHVSEPPVAVGTVTSLDQSSRIADRIGEQLVKTLDELDAARRAHTVRVRQAIGVGMALLGAAVVVLLSGSVVHALVGAVAIGGVFVAAGAGDRPTGLIAGGATIVVFAIVAALGGVWWMSLLVLLVCATIGYAAHAKLRATEPSDPDVHAP